MDGKFEYQKKIEYQKQFDVNVNNKQISVAWTLFAAAVVKYTSRGLARALSHNEVTGVFFFSSLSTSCSLPRLERVPYQASFSDNMVAHSEIFLSKCAQFREQGEFIDVRLKVGEDEFPAHRIVLAANSDYFHAMFANGMKESNQEVIELKDKNISNSALKIVMDSMYSGEINVNDENVFEVLLAADHLQVSIVVQQCCEYLIQLNFDVQTFCRVITSADRHGLKDLKEVMESKMALMYKEICEKEEFCSDMNADVLSALLCRDDLSAPSENFVFKSVIQWIKYRKEERMDVAGKVIGAVRLGLVDISVVIEELDTEEMQVIPEVNMLLQRTLIYNQKPSSSSAFAMEKGKPRSMSSVGEKVFYFFIFYFAREPS